jgi:hypothetical protein
LKHVFPYHIKDIKGHFFRAAGGQSHAGRQLAAGGFDVAGLPLMIRFEQATGFEARKPSKACMRTDHAWCTAGEGSH